MGKVGAAVGWVRDDAVELGVSENTKSSIVESEIHIVWEVEDFAIFGAAIELSIVVRVVIEGIGGTSGAGVGECAEPLIDIDHVCYAGVEFSGRFAELFAKGNSGHVVIKFLVVFDEPDPAVVLGVITHVVDVTRDNDVGLSDFITAGVGIGGVVDEFVLIDGAIATIFELVFEEDGAEASELKDGRAGVNGVR